MLNVNWYQILIELRDSLLPKLISGQIRIPEVEVSYMKA
jgi:hypothetical protein